MTELVTLKFRRGTTNEWIATKSKLSAGEPGFDTTTGVLKIGDGTSMWTDLKSFQASTPLTEYSPIILGFQAGTPGVTGAIAIGTHAGEFDQKVSAIAIGPLAGQTDQGSGSIALGTQAGQTGQNRASVAIGAAAGCFRQGEFAISIGYHSGVVSQGQHSIAIGAGAGRERQEDNTIILNATGNELDGVIGNTGAFYVAPIRKAQSGNYVMNYDPDTFEMTYSDIQTVLNGSTGATGATGEGVDLTNIPSTAIVICDDFGVTGSNEFTFNSTSGIDISANVKTNRLVMTGYGGTYYSDDYGDSWNICTGQIPSYAAACSASGVWIGANGTKILKSSDGIEWVEVFSLQGIPGNDNKYGIGFNGNACVVGTVAGNVAVCSDVTAAIQVWSSPAVQLSGVVISGVSWNPTKNVWWLFGSSGARATVYTFDGINTPTPLVIKDEFGNIIDLFTDSQRSDAWCMCGIQVGNVWVIGGKGLDQVSSLAILTPAATEWTVVYEKTVTDGKNYLRCLATDGTYILGGHTGRAIIRSPILRLDINSWTNYSTVYAAWVDLTYTGGYWFAGVGSPFNLGRCVLWSDTGIRWDQLYVGPGLTTAYTIRASPGLISGVASVMATSFSPKRVGILTANPYTTLDVRGTIASYGQYMNVGASDNGLNFIKNNVAGPISGPVRSAGVFSLDIPDGNVSVIEVVGSFRITTSEGGTFGVLNIDSSGQLFYTPFSPDGTAITGPTMIA